MLRSVDSPKARPAQFLILSAALLAPLIVLLQQAHLYVPTVLARAAFPWADNMWSEQSLYLQLLRFWRGGPLYDPMAATGSYDYAPLYLYALSAVRWIAGLPFDVPTLRNIGITFALLSLIPLALWTAVLAPRFGLAGREPLRRGLVIAVAVLLAFATMTRSPTFDGLHPDDLLLLLCTTLFALYALVVAGRLDARKASYALVVLSLAATFTKQSAIIVLPFLAYGWYAAGCISRNRAIALVVTYVVGVLAIVAVMPGPMREWVTAPIWHPYLPGNIGLFIRDIVVIKPYLGVLFAGAGIALAVIHRRTGQRALVVDGMALLAAASAGIPAYFKRGGGWQDLTLTALLCVPYVATLFWYLVPRSDEREPPFAHRLGAIALTFVALLSFNVAGRPIPGPFEYTRMAKAQVAVDRDVCAKNVSVEATILPSMFVRCKDIKFGSVIAWGEVLNTYLGRMPYPVTLEDDPHTDVVAWLKYPLLAFPGPWISKYRRVESLPVVLGYALDFYDSNAYLQIYVRKR